jgi:hypothetical protein
MSPMNEPFDPTKPVQCRNGRKARIICADAKHQNFPIVALVDRDGAGECPVNFTKDGLEFIGRDSDLDLINTAPPPREIWVNEYVDDTWCAHRTKEQADFSADLDRRLRCVRFVEAK